MVIPFDLHTKAYSHLTGKLPHKSSRGNQYLMVFYNYDANYINVILIKPRVAADSKNTFVHLTNDAIQKYCPLYGKF